MRGIKRMIPGKILKEGKPKEAGVHDVETKAT
jgi:hypothetical protein